MIRLTNFLCLYTIFLVTVLCTEHMRPGLVKINIWVRFFAPTYKVSAMGLKINNIYYEDPRLLGSHVIQTVFHVAFFESVLTWGHITTSRCRSLIFRVGALRVPLFVGGESGIFAYSPPLIGYTIFRRRQTSIVHGVYP
jgi:hypothetical protein